MQRADDFTKMMPEMPSLSFVNTLTRMLLVPSLSSFTIHHLNRKEDVEVGQMFGMDVSKKVDTGEEDVVSILVVGGSPVVRRIGTEAWGDSGWEEFSPLSEDTHLLDEAEARIASCENPSYKEAFSHFKESVCAGYVPKVYHQACGIKVCIGYANMDTEMKRELYSRLVSESNGKPSTGKPFDAAHAKRMLVCETLPVGGGGGFPIDAEGNPSSEGHFRGTSVYQKPESHVNVDWKPISRDEAVSLLRRHGRTLAWHHIKSILTKMQGIEG